MPSLEQEIRAVLGNLGGGEKCPAIVMARYGWDGGLPRTLESVGEEFNITRERVRQVCYRARTRAKGMKRRKMPALDAALAVLRKSAPCTFRRAREVLRDGGLSEGRIDGEGLLSAATFFGRHADLMKVRIGDDGIVVDPRFGGSVGKGRKVARKLVGAHGVATVAEIAEELWGQVPDAEQEVYEDVVQLELDSDPRVVWLDEGKRWLWMRHLPEGRNRLLNNIKKVLSVNSKIEAADLRRAVRRDWRMGGYAPPSSVLLALATVAPGLRREGSAVEADGIYSRTEFLSRTERLIAETLLANGGVMRIEELERAAREAGVGAASFRARMSHSPVIKKYAAGVYGLSGVEVPAEEVEGLVRQRQRGRVLQDCGWTDEGCVWVAYKLNKNALNSAVLAVPASVREFIVGEYRLQEGSGREFGRLVVKDYAAWGMRRILHLSGAEAGDTLVLVFDLTQRKCSCYIGDESVRDEVLTE